MHEVAQKSTLQKCPLYMDEQYTSYQNILACKGWKYTEETFCPFFRICRRPYKENERDLRSWTSLPGNVFAHAFQLDPGSYEIEFRYINKQGLPIYSEFRDVQIKQGHLIHLLETHLAF